MNKGTLWIIGIGPGDPDLITLKALKKIKEIKTILVPIPFGKNKNKSAAEKIIEQILDSNNIKDKLLIPINYKLEKHDEKLNIQWNDISDKIQKLLEDEKEIIYLTLGDPAVYSTSAYLIKCFEKKQVAFDIKIISGISSYSYGANLIGESLCINNESLLLTNAEAIIDCPSLLNDYKNIVIMKIGKKLKQLLEVLTIHNRIKNAHLIKNASMENEEIIHDLDESGLMSNQIGNMSIVIIK